MRLKKLPLPPHLHFLPLLLSHIHLSTTDQYLLTPAHTIFNLLLAHTNPKIDRDEIRKYGNLAWEREFREICWRVEMGEDEGDEDGPVQLGTAGISIQNGKTLYQSLHSTRQTSSSNLHPSSFRWSGTGLEGLDELLLGFKESSHWLVAGAGGEGGGGGGGGIIELAGSKGSGRTLLALHTTLQHLYNNSSASCIWIDTLAAFDAERAEAVLETIIEKAVDPTTTSSPGPPQSIEGVLSRLHLISAFDLDGVKNVLGELGEKLRVEEGDGRVQGDKRGMDDGVVEDVGTGEGKIREKILVINAITPILSPLLVGGTTQGHAQMEAFLSGLAGMIRRYSLLCLVTNTLTPLGAPSTSATASNNTSTQPPSSFPNPPLKPSLGVSFTYFADITLMMQHTKDVFVMDEGEVGLHKEAGGVGVGRRVVEVVRSRVGPASTWTLFQTDGINVYDVSA